MGTAQIAPLAEAFRPGLSGEPDGSIPISPKNSFATDTRLLCSPAEFGDPEIGRLLRPAGNFDDPRQVVEDPTLGLDEKRAILSSWASDACAVESAPSLRRPPSAPAAIAFDEIMEALGELDRI